MDARKREFYVVIERDEDGYHVGVETNCKMRLRLLFFHGWSRKRALSSAAGRCACIAST
ncbi:MAG: hypothetical protein L0332_34600 [Chloroflexi bacterium]|nr:hypothetical protein [Chloroflexota bacterium]MCI0576688.1 hypothetical protein [Chloroflexota bacterium]MCI0646852.1 hypothetical protein [Chloroflexota bacterium]MCI0731826.1 hypothetical protein [Chloroflexota bacterium]